MRITNYVEMPMNDAILRYLGGDAIEPAEAVGMFISNLWGEPFNDFFAREFKREPVTSFAAALFARRDEYVRFLPPRVAQVDTLRELHDSIVDFVRQWHVDTGRAF